MSINAGDEKSNYRRIQLKYLVAVRYMLFMGYLLHHPKPELTHIAATFLKKKSLAIPKGFSHLMTFQVFFVVVVCCFFTISREI